MAGAEKKDGKQKNGDRGPETELERRELNIMLWNVSSSSSRKGMADLIKQQMNSVLTELLRTDYRNLLVLCTDQVRKNKHDILVKHLDKDPALETNQLKEERGGVTNRKKYGGGFEPHNAKSEADIYYRNINRDYDWMYMSCEIIMNQFQYFDAVKPVKRTALILLASMLCRRFATCILKEKKSNKRIVVVSWHGPRHPGKFTKCILLLVQNIQEMYDCAGAFIGGDFNETSDVLRASLSDDLSYLKAEVLDNYELPTDRKEKIDYVVYWPQQTFTTETECILNSLRFSGDGKAFDHPIIMSRVFWKQEKQEEGGGPKQKQKKPKGEE
ncbi:hypothetical protein BaRGS_00038267 [Batillaria attramentaria]|uniref:Endonuclease/exonuclease/phosphatase domain-containing protein n=1 Tax=Batillaria attramentaria TaxID=370345 RepID=A0ABD0J6C5_9CAEN